MKRAAILFFILFFGFCVISSAIAADKKEIEKNVDGIVQTLNQGASPGDINPNDYSPYVFIMKQDGKLLVHPELAGKNLKDIAKPVYKALINSTKKGTWVDYVWKEKQKHSYVRTTNNNLIVGSGYTE